VAKSSEHKMLFDVRGRRKRVIQVVYAALAVLMALSLLTVVGPVSFGDLGLGGSTDDGSDVYDEQAQRIERQLARDPRNEELLVQLTRARYNAGNTGIERDPTTGETSISEEALADFDAAGDAWIRYLKLNPQDPSASVAQLASTALLYSSTLADLDTRVRSAAEAQAIVAEARPSANSYLTLAQYYFLAGDVQAGRQAGEKARQEAPAQQRQFVDQQVEAFRKQSEQLRRQAEQAQQAAAGAGKQALENPVGGLAGGGTGSGSP
jgi:tetratricopeptide (TPR) repeat protein